MQGENKEGKLLFFFKKFQTTSISHYRMMKKTNENSYLSQFMTRYSKACTKMKCTVCYSFIYSLYLTTFRLNLQGYFNEISLNWEHFPTKQERSWEHLSGYFLETGKVLSSWHLGAYGIVSLFQIIVLLTKKGQLSLLFSYELR